MLILGVRLAKGNAEFSMTGRMYQRMVIYYGAPHDENCVAHGQVVGCALKNRCCSVA